jgi:ferritin-like protein
LLLKISSIELEALYYDTMLKNSELTLSDELGKNIAEVAGFEDLKHFEKLIPRIYELGGELPENIKWFYNISAHPAVNMLKDQRDIKFILKTLVATEKYVVNGYSEISNLTKGKDVRTYDLVESILNEEINHKSWLVTLNNLY